MSRRNSRIHYLTKHIFCSLTKYIYQQIVRVNSRFAITSTSILPSKFSKLSTCSVFFASIVFALSASSDTLGIFNKRPHLSYGLCKVLSGLICVLPQNLVIHLRLWPRNAPEVVKNKSSFGL